MSDAKSSKNKMKNKTKRSCLGNRKRQRAAPAGVNDPTPAAPPATAAAPPEEEEDDNLAKIFALRIQALAVSRGLVEAKFIRLEEHSNEWKRLQERSQNRQVIFKAQQSYERALLDFQTLMGLSAALVEAELQFLMRYVPHSSSCPCHDTTLPAKESYHCDTQLALHDKAIAAYDLMRQDARSLTQRERDFLAKTMRTNMSQWFGVDPQSQCTLASSASPASILLISPPSVAEQEGVMKESDLQEKLRHTNIADEPHWCPECGTLLLTSNAVGGNMCETCGEWFPFYTHNVNQIAFRERQPQTSTAATNARTESSDTQFPSYMQRMCGRKSRSRGAGNKSQQQQQQKQEEEDDEEDVPPPTASGKEKKQQQTHKSVPHHIVAAIRAEMADLKPNLATFDHSCFFSLMKSMQPRVRDIKHYYKDSPWLYTLITGKTIDPLSDHEYNAVFTLREELEPILIKVMQEHGESRSNCMNCPYIASACSSLLGLHDFAADVGTLGLANKIKYNRYMREATRRLRQEIAEFPEDGVLMRS